jgi:hypothetical protein
MNLPPTSGSGIDFCWIASSVGGKKRAPSDAYEYIRVDARRCATSGGQYDDIISTQLLMTV